MGIRDSLYFIYDNVKSTDMKLLNVNVNNGMMEEIFLPNKTIYETKIRGGKTYFHGIEYKNLSFPVSFAFSETYDNDLIRSIARWLSPDYYKPLRFSDNLNRIFYAMPIDDIQLIHNGLKEGYLTLTFRCNTYHAYSPVYTSQIYDLSTNPTYTMIQFINNGDLPIYPIIYITKVNNGDLSIFNQTNGDIEFKLIDLTDNENLTIDCENHIIETDLTDAYRYNNFNGNYLKILRGLNNLRIVGTAKIQFKWECKLLQ